MVGGIPHLDRNDRQHTESDGDGPSGSEREGDIGLGLDGFEQWKEERKYGVTSDGTPISLGLRVVDYDRKHGEVTKLAEVEATYTDRRPILWHTVTRDDGTTSIFDGSRLIAESKYREGM